MIYGLIFFNNNLKLLVLDIFSVKFLSSYKSSFSSAEINCISLIKLWRLSVCLIIMHPLESPEHKNLIKSLLLSIIRKS
jgi:hypothetical protein